MSQEGESNEAGQTAQGASVLLLVEFRAGDWVLMRTACKAGACVSAGSRLWVHLNSLGEPATSEEQLSASPFAHSYGVKVDFGLSVCIRPRLRLGSCPA